MKQRGERRLEDAFGDRGLGHRMRGLVGNAAPVFDEDAELIPRRKQPAARSGLIAPARHQPGFRTVGDDLAHDGDIYTRRCALGRRERQGARYLQAAESVMAGGPFEMQGHRAPAFEYAVSSGNCAAIRSPTTPSSPARSHTCALSPPPG